MLATKNSVTDSTRFAHIFLAIFHEWMAEPISLMLNIFGVQALPSCPSDFASIIETQIKNNNMLYDFPNISDQKTWCGATNLILCS